MPNRPNWFVGWLVGHFEGLGKLKKDSFRIFVKDSHFPIFYLGNLVRPF